MVAPAARGRLVIWFVTLVVPEATTRTAVLQTGEVHIAEDLSYADVAALERHPDIRILRGVPAGTPWAIYPNVQKPPTNDPAVRRALHHAINKDAIVRVVFHGQSTAAAALLQPTTPGFAPLAAELFPYDRARAKKILDEAGWRPGSDGIRVKDGKQLEIVWIFGTNNGYEEMAPLIQGMAREVGIDMQLREQPRVQMYEGWRKNENNIGELNWWFPDPSILTTNFHTSRLHAFNPARLSDPEIDKPPGPGSRDDGRERPHGSLPDDPAHAPRDWGEHPARRPGDHHRSPQGGPGLRVQRRDVPDPLRREPGQVARAPGSRALSPDADVHPAAAPAGRAGDPRGVAAGAISYAPGGSRRFRGSASC
jgi:hypothetical protein